MRSLLVTAAAYAVVATPPFINPGTPAGVPASYDCAVRKHAWEYGKTTLPQRGDFKTLYDALQLQACDVPTPSTEDTWTPPQYPTPSSGAIFVDSKAAHSGSGTKEAPFRTIAEALSAAVSPSTILLREGTYHTEQLRLTQKHSKVTIQNYEGERAVVSGAVPLKVNGVGAWAPHRVMKPTWVVHSGRNNVYGRANSKNDTDAVKYLGETASLEACKALAANSTKGPFGSLTWHSPSFGPPYATQCFGAVSDYWSPVAQAGVDSARIEEDNTWKLDLKGQGVKEITGLRLGEERAIRAKYPNGHPEMSGEWYFSNNPGYGAGEYGQGWATNPTTFTPPLDQDKKWAATKDLVYNGKDWPGVEWPLTQEGNSTWTGEGDWGDYHIGMGGFCDDISPPTGYWCSQNPPRGQCYDHEKKTSSGCTQTHMAPSGLSYDQMLPQAANYSNVRGAVVQVWRGGGRWFTNQCLVDGIDKETSQIMFNQDVGCNQGGEGEIAGTQWWIENVKEECDSPGEFFYDADEEALYYTFNTSQTPTGDEQFVATRTKVLFNITGTQTAPVQDVTIRGLVIRDAMLTYLGTDVADIHGMPSGGDWALQRSGAILMEGTERTTVDNNLITRVDGNGVFVSNYNRNVTLSNNEMSWIGDSAMAAWGSTGTCLNANCTDTIPYGGGPDGRGGNYPSGTKVVGNLVREIGIWQKQSSMWFQAVTARTTLSQNVHFNGPRAGVNYNDGFGGGDVMEGNLLANCVRESGDHGPFNSWDRVPYITDMGMHRVFNKDNVTGELPGHEMATGPSVLPRFREIRHNFVFDVYSSQEAIDNDDGSSYYLTHNNYFVYASAGLKSDFGGQWNHHFENVYAYVDTCFGQGNNLAFFNNTCQTKTSDYSSTCNMLTTMTVRNNNVHSLKNVTICAGDTATTWSAYLDDDTLSARGAAAMHPFPKKTL